MNGNSEKCCQVFCLSLKLVKTRVTIHVLFLKGVFPKGTTTPRCISKCTVSVSVRQVKRSVKCNLDPRPRSARFSLSTPRTQLQTCVQLLLSAFIPQTTFCKYCACAHIRTRPVAKTNGIRCSWCNHLANENTKQRMLQF